MDCVEVPSVARSSKTLQETPLTKYEPEDDEIIEHGSLLIPGETPPDDEDLLPVRLLNNFVVYNNCQERDFQFFEPLTSNVISGFVFPYYGDEEEEVVDDESEEDDEGQPMCLDKIDKYWIDATYHD